MTIWTYAICPYAHIVRIVWSYNHIYCLGRGGVGERAQPRPQPDPSRLRFDAFMHTLLNYFILMGICHMPVWAGPYAICPCGHMPIWVYSINAFMPYYTLLYLWEYAIYQYEPSHMPYARMVICPYEYILVVKWVLGWDLFKTPAGYLLYYTIHYGNAIICPCAICPYESIV